jgi:hypothetical protein
VQREHDACRSGHALASGESMKNRKQMAEKRRDRNRRHCPIGDAERRSERLREEHRQPAFGAVADERKYRRFPVSGAQHVGRAGIARAVAVRVGKAERPARYDRERDRPQQVRGDDECQ